MKKLQIGLLCILVSLSVSAQKVTIKLGTIVSLESVKQVKAADVHVGESVDFRVVRDVKVGDVVAIPAGAVAKGTVYEAKRSTAFGTKGRLGINLRFLLAE